MKQDSSAETKTLHGVPVHAGIVIGKAHLVDRSQVKIIYQYIVDDGQVEREIERFKDSVKTVENQLIAIKNGMPEKVKDHSFILDSHLMMLKDSMFLDASIKKIRKEKINAEWAVKKSLQEIREVFGQIEDDYIRDRISDVENVTERILRTLSGEMQQSLAEINQRVIIVAHDLSPADTTELNLSKVKGFITDIGGKTSHTAIMAQALEIPAVVGLKSATQWVHDGDLLIVDGTTGDVIINPDDQAILHAQEKQLKFEKYQSSIVRLSHLPAETLDGFRIAVSGNIEFLEEVAAVKDNGGEGIGLYRTEFLYLRNKGFPSEEELFEDYREVAEIINPFPVRIRTLDLGGDKFASKLDISKELNPALGLRAIRFCLKEPDIFKSQLSAILRASIYGKIELMFPMVSGLQELIDAKKILDEVKSDLDHRNIEYDRDMKIGIMIEVPAAVAVADVLARHVDFFSIGTNDLIQYSLAIDRVNENVAYMYQPFHPAILRMLKFTVQAAKKEKIPVSLCGEMAGDPLCVAILLCLGFDGLSMNARAIPLIKKIIRATSMEQARLDFENVMALDTAKEVNTYVLERVRSQFPELVERGYI
ncbi:MAG TPA: phosphoenolpyruvate--protein phosphotransferase [Deltaproteobacteria bacterium]|nr:phosphoenolpyruvate--protein phosphotransferase [Deltaproteobacteria bacterium]